MLATSDQRVTDQAVMERRLQDVRHARLYLWHVNPHDLATLQQAKRLAFARWLRVTRGISEWEVGG